MKKIVVLGGGISGYGSAILAKKKGFNVFLSDKGRIADRYKAKLDQWQAKTFEQEKLKVLLYLHSQPKKSI